MSEVIYGYDELGRPIVADMTFTEDGRLGNQRTFPLIPRLHDWGLGSRLRLGKRGKAEVRLVRVLREVYRWGRRYGLPNYVIDTAALTARKMARKDALSGLKLGRDYERYELVAVALLKNAAKVFGIHFRATYHKKGLLKMMRTLKEVLK